MHASGDEMRRGLRWAALLALAACALWPAAAGARATVFVDGQDKGPVTVGLGASVSMDVTVTNCGGTTHYVQWWAFGDGATDSDWSGTDPCTQPFNTTHAYAATGSYQVEYSYYTFPGGIVGFFQALFCANDINNCPRPEQNDRLNPVKVVAAAGLASFDIQHDGSGLTCPGAPESVTITALNSGGNPLQNYAGTVTVTTSAGHGTWALNTGAGSFSDAAADDGAATYTFDPNDNGQVILDLTNQHADDLTITVSDAAAGVSSTEPAPLSFRDNAFVIVPTTTTGGSGATYNDLCEGGVTGSAEVAAGRAHGFRAALCRRDPGTNQCGVATAYDGAMGLKAWLARDADDPGGAAPSVGGAPLPDAAPAANNLTLSFTNGIASFALNTSDVGKYGLNLRDDTSGFAQDPNGNPRPIDGTSPTLTTRPFALAITDVNRGGTPNPGGTAPGDAVFAAAGDALAATVSGALWQAADDADDDGVPDLGSDLSDNALTPSYAWDTTISADEEEGHTPSTAVGGVLGAVNNGAVAQADFVGGQATASGLDYTEVGSFSLEADATGYLNSAGVDVNGHSAPIGRFTPDHFDVAVNTPELDAGCGGAFSYLDQPLTYATAPRVTITARNAAGATTMNYYDFTGAGGDDWWRLPDINEAYADAGMPAGVGIDDSAAGHSPGADAPTVNGQVVIDFSGPLAYDRPTSGGGPAPDAAPFASALTVSFDVIDADGIAYASNPFSFGIGFVGGNDEIRHGRLALGNAHGSELVDLPVPVTVQYFAGAGTGFVTAAGDTCTALTDAPAGPPQWGDFELPTASYRDNLDEGETAPSWPGLTNGAGALTLSAPGAGNDGSVDPTVHLEPAGADRPWLQYDWDGDGAHDDNPAARATFGIFSNEVEWIYQREVY